MPVTINAVDHPATGWNDSKVSSDEKLLEEACPKQYRRCQRIVQSSFSRSSLREEHVSASQNGFVWAAYHAYSKHHHLTIRPEDVWFAILTQMSFFINANAEELRAFFVAHEGQKELEVVSEVADFGNMARMMTHMIAKNVSDPGLRDWVMPSFTTTTDSDKVVGAVLFMGAMQKYFSFKMTVCCGIPSVTLLGDVEDWREISRRLDKLDQLGREPSLFAEMLRPVLSHMILSFENPASPEVVHFWNTIVHRHHLGSGTDYLTGWLTAFCFWDEQGRAKGMNRDKLFGSVSFPYVDVDSIPMGSASVPVKVDDNGDEYEATMVAGSVGIIARASPVAAAVPTGTVSAQSSSVSDETVPLDTVQPLSGWWIYENEAGDAAEQRALEMEKLRKDLDTIWEGPRETRDYGVLGQLGRRLAELEAF